MARYRDYPAVVDALARHAAGRPIVAHADPVVAYLESPALRPRRIVTTDGRAIVLDLSVGSMMLGEPLSGLAVERFSRLVGKQMAAAQTSFAFGRWGERREVYQSELFTVSEEQPTREVHMGVDVFCAPDTPVCAPLDGTVCIKANNDQLLDYGPLVVLRHAAPAGEPFYTLYGHLALASLAELQVGQGVVAGEQIARVGAPPENGNWPPHLHFQLILDLLELGRSFPGVALRSEQDVWLALSPLPSRFFSEIDPAALDGRLA